jgi:hypothetical protein
MGRIDDAIRTLEAMDNGTERALQVAGLISTLFKIKGVVLVITDQLAFDSYANTESEKPEVQLAAFAGKLAPRTILEVMRGQLYAKGSLYHWTVAGIPVRIHDDALVVHRKLCRDFTTDHGLVKLLPVEEITADCILAAVYPVADPEAQTQAHRLLVNGLAEAFQMDWAVLQSLCDRPEYRVGEELARMRLEAKKDVDAMGAAHDPAGRAPEVAPEGSGARAPSASEEAVDTIPLGSG